MASWGSFYDALPAADRPVVQEKLASLAAYGNEQSRYRRAVGSLEGDQRLHQETCRELGALIVATRDEELPGVITSFCQTRTLLGKTADYRLPLLRARPFKAFCRDLLRQDDKNGGPISEDTVLELLISLTNPATWEMGTARCDDLGIAHSIYAVWATFSENGEEVFPPGTTAQEIACDLGFDDADGTAIYASSDLPILLFTYDPNDPDPHIPTAIEAWASEPLNYYFSPSLAGRSWGYTQPWPTKTPRGTPRPEVVHGRIPLVSLTQEVVEFF